MIMNIFAHTIVIVTFVVPFPEMQTFMLFLTSLSRINLFHFKALYIEWLLHSLNMLTPSSTFAVHIVLLVSYVIHVCVHLIMFFTCFFFLYNVCLEF